MGDSREGGEVRAGDKRKGTGKRDRDPTSPKPNKVLCKGLTHRSCARAEHTDVLQSS